MVHLLANRGGEERNENLFKEPEMRSSREREEVRERKRQRDIERETDLGNGPRKEREWRRYDFCSRIGRSVERWKGKNKKRYLL